MHARHAMLLLACVLTGLRPAAAENWPARPLTMVVPFAAGGGTDVLGRILGRRLSEILGQQVIIENVGGAGGMVGSARVAKAAPDGYQFVLGSRADAINQTLYKNPLYNLATDLAPVALIADQPTLLVARNDLPVGNLVEFIAYARANQASMQMASAGAGRRCVRAHRGRRRPQMEPPWSAAGLASSLLQPGERSRRRARPRPQPPSHIAPAWFASLGRTARGRYLSRHSKIAQLAASSHRRCYASANCSRRRMVYPAVCGKEATLRNHVQWRAAGARNRAKRSVLSCQVFGRGAG